MYSISKKALLVSSALVIFVSSSNVYGADLEYYDVSQKKATPATPQSNEMGMKIELLGMYGWHFDDSSASSTVWATDNNGVDPAEQRFFGPDNSLGGSFGAGVDFGNSLDVMFRMGGWFSLETDDSYDDETATLFLQNINTGDPITTSSVNVDKTTLESTIYSADFEAGKHISVSSMHGRLYGGIRYLKTNVMVINEFSAAANIASVGLDDDEVFFEEKSYRFDGIGPKVGLDFKMPIGWDGAYASFGGEGAVVFGETRKKTNFYLKEDNGEAFNWAGNSQFDLSGAIDDYKVNASGKIGIGMNMGNNMNFEAGYKVDYYSDTASKSHLTSVSEVKKEDPSNTFIHGIYGGITYKF